MSTFSPVSGSTSVWKVRRGWDWFSDIHRAFSGNMVSEIGKCVSLARDGRENVALLAFIFTFMYYTYFIRVLH